MNIEPAIIYGAFGVVATVIAVLWRKFEAAHSECVQERKECQKERQELIEHTIAQQHDIQTFRDTRKDRGLPPLQLKSEKTMFFKRHVEGEA